MRPLPWRAAPLVFFETKQRELGEWGSEGGGQQGQGMQSANKSTREGISTKHGQRRLKARASSSPEMVGRFPTSAAETIRNVRK